MSEKEFRGFLDNETDWEYEFLTLYSLDRGNNYYELFVNNDSVEFIEFAEDEINTEYSFSTFIDKHNSGELYD